MSWVKVPIPSRRKSRRMPNLNLPPGTLQVEPGSAKPVLTAFGFSPSGFEEVTIGNPEVVRALLA